MAFVPQTTFLPRWSGSPSRPSCARRPRLPLLAMCETVKSRDAMEFFRHREGQWSSWRVTHHLAFRRSESGESEIEMRVLEPSDKRIAELCRDWEVEPSAAQGGCHVTWKAVMAWDQEGENHEGETVFALVPDADDVRKGRILRDRGYAEIVPIAGTYYMDENDDLNLETPYDGGAVEERFSFDGPDVVNRLSTVRRFGGFSTATFATERRAGSEPPGTWDAVAEGQTIEEMVSDLMLDGPLYLQGDGDEAQVAKEEGANAFSGRQRLGAGAGQWGTKSSSAPPSAKSAFGSGFSSGPAAKMGNGNGSAKAAEEQGAAKNENGNNGLSGEILEAAEKAGIDLAKIPPSMRDDFVASFNNREK